MKIYVIDAKKVKRILSFVIVLMFSALITVAILACVDATIFASSDENVAADPTPIRRIIIDAGHGGEDPGAIASDGSYEKDLNLSIAMLLKEKLEAEGYEVVMTRIEDKMLYSESENIKGMRKLSDLKNRCRIAKENPDALFVSIHMNTFGSSEYSGLQVYYGDKDDESRLLANYIQTEVKESLQPTNNRSVKGGRGLYLLENLECVSVLIECGFLSNPEECAKLSEKEYQNQLSLAIACGIIEYINSKGDGLSN